MAEPFSDRELSDEEVEKLVEEDNVEAFSKLLNANKALADQVLELQGSESADEIRTKARTWALQHLEVALATIAELVVGAEKDSTRLSAARTIWGIASSTTGKDDSDPLAELFKRISE